MKLTKIATVLLFLSPAYLSAAIQDFTYHNGYKITADQASPEVNIRIKDNKPTQSISTPNSNGISHNYFTEFNVGKNGLNIDNSPSARVIINEVTGTNISQLDGTVAIIGKQASLVIANPNGISCNNCGVSNISHLTLLAGNTSPDITTGKLTGFKNITNDVIVNNVRKNAIKSKLTLTGKNIELKNSYLNSPEIITNVGIDAIDLSNTLQSQIADVNSNKEAKGYNSHTQPSLTIDSDTKIRGNLLVNADNATVINDGNIISSNINLNLMDSEFSNDGYLKSSKMNINSKDAWINNNKKLSVNNLNINYRGDLNINNRKEADSDSFSAKKIVLNSRNVGQHAKNSKISNKTYFVDNSMKIKNYGDFLFSQLRIDGNQYDDVLIVNEGTILSDKIGIKANAITVYNNDIFLVRSEFDDHTNNGFYDFGNKKITMPEYNTNM